MWTELKEQRTSGRNESFKVLLPEEAIKRSASLILKNYISDGDLNIVSVEKGYYTGDLYNLFEKPVKAYIVRLDNDDVFYIDIESGQVIQ